MGLQARVITAFLSGLFWFGSAAISAADADRADATLRDLYESEHRWYQEQQGKRLNEKGNWVSGPTLPPVDAETRSENLARWESALRSLARIPQASLSPQERVNAAVFRQILETRVSDLHYKTYEAPLNSDSFFWTGLHPRNRGFDARREYLDYLSRLEQLPRYFAEHAQNMRAGLKRGYSVPRITLQGRDQSVAAYLSGGKQNPFWEPMEHIPAAVSAEDKEQLRKRALTAIGESVIPAYTELLRFLREDYLPATRTSLAARDLPDGEAFYQTQIRAYTTLDLTPKEIHQRGLEEVERIRREMLGTIEDAEFAGNIQDFIQFLRTDPQFYAKTPDELLGYASYVAKRTDARLGDILGFLPRARFTIMPVPDAIAPFYTSGRGGLDSCLMNTYNLPARPLYALAALTLHECAPGHALQAAIAQEGPGDVPDFREDNYFSGYGEGWGLYTEWLGVEMGIYRTPYEHFGRLSFEMWRACRLVIDTGIHQYGWSRKQAQDYLALYTALSIHDITTEVDRYISWPGQALAYKLGEMLIREKRAAAEAALGSEFDVRYFHDTILGLRSVPLTLLAEELDRWIAAGGPNPYPDV